MEEAKLRLVEVRRFLRTPNEEAVQLPCFPAPRRGAPLSFAVTQGCASLALGYFRAAPPGRIAVIRLRGEQRLRD